MQKERVILIVLDSLGVGALPDASLYGDEGSNTLGNLAKARGGLQLPHLGALGLGCLTEVAGVPCPQKPLGAFGRMAERSKGKDTTTGHWELTGVILEKPFPVFPSGFPRELVAAFEKAIGRPVLGNVKASGTEIIQELGPRHQETGYPIVYTSADSVWQIAAHEEVVPLETLYRWCETARRLLTGEYAVGRVIARPFVGEPGAYVRTANRKDFSLAPPRPTLLDHLEAAGHEVLGIGKIADIFAGRGVTRKIKTGSNDEGMQALIAAMDSFPCGLIFVNLVDFDMVYGHRRNVEGYAHALEQVDRQLPQVTAKMKEKDLLIIVADHGCDPTTSRHTDHTREYVPLLVFGDGVSPVNLGIRETFADVGQTIAELLGAEPLAAGTSFGAELGLKC